MLDSNKASHLLSQSSTAADMEITGTIIDGSKGRSPACTETGGGTIIDGSKGRSPACTETGGGAGLTVGTVLYNSSVAVVGGGGGGRIYEAVTSSFSNFFSSLTGGGGYNIASLDYA
jgi:hypothetical protein